MKRQYLISGCGYSVIIPTKKELNNFNKIARKLWLESNRHDNAMEYAITQILCSKFGYTFESHMKSN
jgi:hypothetical protein